MLDINFLNGVSLGPDHAWATGLGLSENETDEERVHLLVEWRRDQGFDIYQLALEPFGLAVAPEPGDVPTLLVMYSSGRVDVFRGDTSSFETIASPPQLRPLRDLRRWRVHFRRRHVPTGLPAPPAQAFGRRMTTAPGISQVHFST